MQKAIEATTNLPSASVAFCFPPSAFCFLVGMYVHIGKIVSNRVNIVSKW